MHLHRLEKVNLKSIRSQAKLFGTLATVAGAMIMTLVKGPIIELFWTKAAASNHGGQGSNGTTIHNSIKGALMITAGCFSWSAFIILQASESPIFSLVFVFAHLLNRVNILLQAITMKTYPAELSLTVWICFLGTVEGTVAALIMERGKASIWSINWDAKLMAAVYSVRILKENLRFN